MPTIVHCFRHGETEWSRTGRHTGTSDIDLTEYGEIQARALRETLTELAPDAVYTSPLRQGAPDLRAGRCERRADAAIDDLRRLDARVAVFAHGHFLRVFAARWCGLDAAVGRHLILDPATISVLGWERDIPCIDTWNAAVS